jgi:hypothetical protein
LENHQIPVQCFCGHRLLLGGNRWALGGVRMTPRSFWVGNFETRNFTFTTYAESEFDAFQQLETAWNEHKERTGAWHDFAVYLDCITIAQITIPHTEIN